MTAIGFFMFVSGGILALLIGREYPGNWIAIPILTWALGGAVLMLAGICSILWRFMP
ncbi:TPA: hypothetical protein QDC06_000256 [Burkholderia cepacia]|nr:hypothetical protein [Burkholderia cepacia]